MNSNVLKVQFTLFQDLTLVVVRVNRNCMDKINGGTMQLACVAGVLRGRGRRRIRFGRALRVLARPYRILPLPLRTPATQATMQ